MPTSNSDGAAPTGSTQGPPHDGASDGSPAADWGAAADRLYTDTVARYDEVEPWRSRDDVNYYRDLAIDVGGPILELGSGTGRILLPLAMDGHHVTGLERVAAMQGLCASRLAELPADLQNRVHLIDGDMRDIAAALASGGSAAGSAEEAGPPYALILMPFRTFHHLLTPADQATCLASVHQHLRPGGIFALDLAAPNAEQLAALGAQAGVGEFRHDPPRTLDDGTLVDRCHRYMGHDVANGLANGEIIDTVTLPDGTTHEERFSYQVRYTLPADLDAQLAAAGFQLLDRLADFDGTPFDELDTGDQIVVARRM